MMAEPDVLLSVANLACRRGKRSVFSGISFDVQAGDALIVKGANGSGKTSLLRLLSGLGVPESGTIRRTHRCSFLGHANALKPALTVSENLGYWQGVSGASANMDVVAAFGLSAFSETPVRFLSQGQQRRVALARACTAQAPVWIFDEPTVGLDASAVDMLGALVRTHRQNGGALIASTHVDLAIGATRLLELRT
jgi:heme exporter protein A